MANIVNNKCSTLQILNFEFHIVSAEIKLEKFNGPLDLLLQLIEQEKMSITELAISEVTEQFMDYLSQMEEAEPEELADFLIIATKLVYVKSKNLLPYLKIDEEDDGPSLADQLRIYKKYLEAAKKINDLWLNKSASYGRLEPPVKVEGFLMPTNAQAENLYVSLLSIIKRLKPLASFPKVTLDRTISIKQRMQSIKNIMEQYKKINFSQILENSQNRTEVIITFLAVLDLLKEKVIYIEQTQSFSELVLEKI